jgi:hypothetical protein
MKVGTGRSGMGGNFGEQRRDGNARSLEERDSPEINDLIEKLNRDLEQTQQSISRRR